MRPLSDQVVVITGASSGIGRETARLLASRGAAVVLVARNEVALEDLHASIVAAGGRALVVVADVSDYAAVRRIADEAVAAFGRIDTWVNDAGVSFYAPLAEAAADELERVIRVNLLGVIYGTKVALEHLRAQDEGAVINISSVLGTRAVPLQSAYVASKYGVKGFTDAVRLELLADRSRVSMTTIYPASINTPFFENARSRLGAQPSPIPPVYDPRVVAQAIAAAAERPLRDVNAGGAGKLLTLADWFAPGLTDRIMSLGRFAERRQQADRPDTGQDNLEDPLTGPGRSRGTFGGAAIPHDPYTALVEVHPVRRRLAPLVAVAAAGASVVAARSLVGRMRRG
jgi:short-subunit dehydrogenase